MLRDAAGRSLADLAQDWTSLREKAKTPAFGAGRLQRRDILFEQSRRLRRSVDAFDSIVPIGACGDPFGRGIAAAGASFTLACDHRVVFGADAARFLETLEQQLKDPEKLVTVGDKAMTANFPERRQRVQGLMLRLGRELPGRWAALPACTRPRRPMVRLIPSQGADRARHRRCRPLRILASRFTCMTRSAAGATRAEVLETLGVARDDGRRTGGHVCLRCTDRARSIR